MPRWCGWPRQAVLQQADQIQWEALGLSVRSYPPPYHSKDESPQVSIRNKEPAWDLPQTSELTIGRNQATEAHLHPVTAETEAAVARPRDGLVYKKSIYYVPYLILPDPLHFLCPESKGSKPRGTR